MKALIPLKLLTQNLHHMHCKSGYRSTATASILKERGFEKLVNLHGLFDDIVASAIPTTTFACSSSKI